MVRRVTWRESVWLQGRRDFQEGEEEPLFQEELQERQNTKLLFLLRWKSIAQRQEEWTWLPWRRWGSSATLSPVVPIEATKAAGLLSLTEGVYVPQLSWQPCTEGQPFLSEVSGAERTVLREISGDLPRCGQHHQYVRLAMQTHCLHPSGVAVTCPKGELFSGPWTQRMRGSPDWSSMGDIFSSDFQSNWVPPTPGKSTQTPLKLYLMTIKAGKLAQWHFNCSVSAEISIHRYCWDPGGCLHAPPGHKHRAHMSFNTTDACRRKKSTYLTGLFSWSL
jgi:hypothetical protein